MSDAIRIRRLTVLRGANWVADGSVVVALLEGHFAPASWAAVWSLLGELLPSGPPPGPDGPAPTTSGAAVEAVAAVLCRWAGHPPVARRRTPMGAEAGNAAVLPLWHEGLTTGALRLAARLVARATEGAADEGWLAGDRQLLAALREDAASWLKGSRRWIARAAEARGIAWRPVAAAPHLLLLGEGRHGRRFNATATWKTTHISGSIASDKRAANRMLRNAGVPAARQRVVADVAALRAAASEFGLPVVVKPSGARLQEGVTFLYGLDGAEQAFADAAALGSAVVVESFLPGREYRVLVIDGAVVEAFERPPPLVVGDGQATIGELVRRENARPERGRWRDGFPISPISLDGQSAAYLAHEGRSLDDVPAAGEVVPTHPMPMLRFGGHERVEITDRIHPDNRALAIRALEVLGLDVGGIDFRTPDITRSWREVGAGICEVNPQPDLSAHYMPGLHGDVAGTLVDTIFPSGTRHRMHHVVLLGDGGLVAHGEAVAGALRARFGWRTALACEGAGVDLAGYRSYAAPRSIDEAYALVVEDPTLDASVFTANAEHVAAAGLGLAHADVALVAGSNEARIKAAAAATLRAATNAVYRLPATPAETVAVVIAAIERAGRDSPAVRPSSEDA